MGGSINLSVKANDSKMQLNNLKQMSTLTIESQNKDLVIVQSSQQKQKRDQKSSRLKTSESQLQI